MAKRNKCKKLLQKRNKRYYGWISTKKMVKNLKNISNKKKSAQDSSLSLKNIEKIFYFLKETTKIKFFQNEKEENKTENIFNSQKGIEMKNCRINEKRGIRIKEYNKISNSMKFKNIMISMKLLLIMSLLQLLSSYEWYSILSNSSIITLTIRGSGNRKIFGFSGEDTFNSAYYPDEVCINNELQVEVKYSYIFEEEENYVELYWENEINNTEYMFKDCSDIIEFDFYNFDTSEIILMKEMFSGCSSITSLDLYYFDTRKVVDMNDMFSGCSLLTSIYLSSFDTSHVTRMNYMFSGCSSLTSLDLSNFDTSQVIRINQMFNGCSNLEYINLENFNEISLDNNHYSSMFNSVKANVVICIDEEKTAGKIFPQINSISCKVIDCSDNWKISQKKLKDGTNECLDECYSYQFEYNNICYDDCPSGMENILLDKKTCINEDDIPENYYWDNNGNMYKKCYNLCKSCSQSGSGTNNNCNECTNGYIFLSESSVPTKNCFKQCQFYYYFSNTEQYTCVESCPSGYNKIVVQKGKCIDDCKKDDQYKYDNDGNCLKNCPDNKKNYEEEKKCLDECYSYQFEYNNICYNNCPSGMVNILQNIKTCINEDDIPDNYYLDNNDNIYKECYNLCKRCRQSGTEIINNCDECINEYIFLNDSYVPQKNCYKQCDYYYYLNESNNYICTEYDNCPLQYYKKINQRKKCIDDCRKDEFYIYDYYNTCLSKCPDNIKNYEEEKKCLDECYSYQFEYRNICYNDCPINTYRLFNYRNICVDEVPENYYLDKEDNIYKECYDLCKSCNQSGNETINNCKECIYNYTFLNDSYVPPQNCYKICDYYYYLNESENYFCTEYNFCPFQFVKLIEPRTKCIEDCRMDDEYIYDYYNICLSKCPDNIKNYEEEKKCLYECYSYQFEYRNVCYNDCPINTYRLFNYRNICVDEVPENYYLDYNDNIYKECYNLCKYCNQSGNETINNCNECINNYTFLNDSYVPPQNCYKICDYYYFLNESENYICTEYNFCPLYFDKLINPRKKCIEDCRKDEEYIYDYNNTCIKNCPDNIKNYEEEKKCLDECYSYQFEYKNICYNDCPINTYRLFNYRNICVDEVPENYYLDNNDNIYKECYDLCKRCSQSGNETINNCDECINEYIFLNDSYVPIQNCYKNCNYYYYLNESENYICTENDVCPFQFNKLIEPRKKCIDDCRKDDYYKYELDKHCLVKCPENMKTDDDEKKCLKSCQANQIEYNNECHNEFPNTTGNIFEDGNIIVNNHTNFENLLNNIILTAYPPEKGKSLVIQKADDTICQITNTKNDLELLKNMSNNKNNISIIDLGECELLLKKVYHVNENDSLIFVKNECKSGKASEKNINFEIYEPYNKTKLNLSICDTTSINLYVPILLSEENKQVYEQMKESGYNMFDLNDPFYQDICTPFDSGNGTDILLSDRVNFIYNNDDTKCQSNCQFSQYSIDSGYINCSCSTIENKNNEITDKFTAKKIYESFYDVLKYSNYNIIKCYNAVFDIKKTITVNIGSMIVILFFIGYMICLFIFIYRGTIPLRIKLRIDLNEAKEKNNLEFKLNVNNILYPPIKTRSIIKSFHISYNEEKINNKIKGRKNNLNFDNKKIIDDKIRIYPGRTSKNVFDSLKNNKFEDFTIKEKLNISKKEIVHNTKREYADLELNELEYLKAIELDKRSFLQMYWATLRREHLIIFTFIAYDDYNLLSIKLTRFIFLIVGDMALNVFFFSDDSMHKLFLNYGKYDFFQQIPQITYSTIISQLIEVLLCFLSLTDKYIYQIKRFLVKGKSNRINKIIRRMYIKLIFFYIFTFIFFLIYWYIITVFCGVYRNTQKAFIKDSIISFSICLVYPFFLYLISSGLRFCSLRDSKKRFKCLYKLSDIIPLF